MGILNITPDSFFDQGSYFSPDKALAQAKLLSGQGADILDIGAESTRPFSAPVPPETELERLLPILNKISRSRPISVDTRKATVAAQVLAAGASIINDVSACTHDPALEDVLAHYKPGYVLMHSQGGPETMQAGPSYIDTVSEVLTFLEKNMSRLIKSGLPEENIVLDPGIGFGKTLRHNLELLRHMERFTALGRPVLIGLSNKSLWGDLLGLPVNRREGATQAAIAACAGKGPFIYRVHNVAATRITLETVQALS